MEGVKEEDGGGSSIVFGVCHNVLSCVFPVYVCCNVLFVCVIMCVFS